MQHYRLPTRLLDWSESPLIALWFALDSDADGDCVIWGLHPAELNRLNTGTRVIYNSVDRKVEALIAPAFNIEYKPPAQVLAIFGAETDLRMALQLSAFTIHSTSQPLDDIAENAGVLARIVVPAEAREDLRNTLVILGLRRSTLFPDLENLARELATQTFVE